MCGEAWIGPSLRRDERPLPLSRAQRSGDFNGDWAVEAAEHLGDPSLYPIPEAVLGRLDPDDQARFGAFLDRALEACRAKGLYSVGG